MEKLRVFGEIPKDERNTCAVFAPRTTVERQTGTPGPTTARQAFDDLFK